MPTDACLTNFARRDWLTDGPLNDVVAPYIEALRNQRYPDHTIRAYLGGLAHFSHWIKTDEIRMSRLDAALIKRFLHDHLPACTCPAPCYPSAASSGAALRHMLRLLPGDPSAATLTDPVAVELERFGEYLSNICGLAPVTRDRRVHHVGTFLVREFGVSTPVIAQLSAARLDTFFAELSSHLRPSSLRVVGNSLRSYFRYRALLGESTAALAASLPRIADWRRTTLPKVLADAELDAFLKAFDRADPVGLRDYAIARCLLDLGLRGHEVTYLTLESVDWRSATLTISSTKSKRVQQLPLPESTGEAIAQYLRRGRPQTVNRALFVRHRAPFDKPLGVPAIRNSMNRAFVRCGLSDRFCNTHVLRRTMATHLQRSGASVKEIADFLRHQSLDTANSYARVDLEGLRAVALPWPGSRS
ncbi:tyrosine-type recombinase/integrase [Aromatoleum anaerobium]|uniref:Tyrosine-type recombinase/integrase n=2 Tax=Aromatoleum TaxID=551759 RepID=A0ABX1PTG6_9RHOO|nr:tyrosine-type recombinase/integrase [Aromatoleum anaerobium]MCK0505432.1 tyrosine-type recombinase/integrase [Aromatoleum anaerobium]MCK0507994.1 tyrosine-type recombinase/integrase [Aromatoleum anaerobium]MCK0508446.1 tyrosine-type recombinase/integrase [Aromatoleum anaerobium]MCK0509128.1 tyrosine-type recombinase/integrase [Aromatoleum anaerobium]